MNSAKKYATRCIDNATGQVLMDREMEAINKSEAETRAFLNCIKFAGNKPNINVVVKKA
jgi:hypothetical protein